MTEVVKDIFLFVPGYQIVDLVCSLFVDVLFNLRKQFAAKLIANRFWCTVVFFLDDELVLCEGIQI